VIKYHLEVPEQIFKLGKFLEVKFFGLQKALKQTEECRASSKKRITET